MRRVALLLSLLLLAGLAPLSHASGFLPPADARTASAGGVGLAHWVGADPSLGTVDDEIAANATGTLWFGMQKAPFNATAGDANATQPMQRAYVNLTSSDLLFATPNLVLAGSYLTTQTWDYANTTFTTNRTEGAASYNFTVEVYREDANGTVLLGATSGSGAVQVASVPVEQPPVGVPMPYLVGGGAVVVVGGAAALYALKQRREKRLMNQAPRRSQVMRELELERELEKVEEKEPERAAEIKQEIRAQEVVREKRRELQILEAKRADALKTMDLLRKRHESGGLTKLQYDNMVAKKQADLQRIEAEIAQMEAEDAAGGAAA